MRRTAFYCVCDAGYFLGAVGMINSLRLQGHEEPIFVLDCGLRPEQRELLAPHVTLVTGPSDRPPHLVKTVAPLAHPTELMVLIDADMIVTRPLHGLIEDAAAGRVVAFKTGHDRYLSEWGELLGLGPIRHGPYISSGLVLLGGSLAIEVLRLMDELGGRIDFDSTLWGEDIESYPFRYADQDVLNAILRARDDPDRLLALDARLAPVQPFSGLRVLEGVRPRCADRDGTEPYVVHHILPSKPWLVPGHESAYSLLLRRLLCGDDVAIKVPRRDVPRRLRTGPLGYADQKRVNLREQLRWRVGGFVRERFGGRAREGAAR